MPRRRGCGERCAPAAPALSQLRARRHGAALSAAISDFLSPLPLLDNGVFGCFGWRAAPIERSALNRLGGLRPDAPNSWLRGRDDSDRAGVADARVDDAEPLAEHAADVATDDGRS